MDKPLHVLKNVWGYTSFRPLQEEIIQTALDGKDVLALLPTGGGKSICFQIPALMKPGLCLVISPLIALMKDQVENLKKRNVKAASLHSGMSHSEVDIVLDNCIYGDIKFLYVSPERLKSEIFIERLKQMDISLLAIDESHCISQWGHDFRPSYLQIGEIRELKPEANVVAVTATATDLVKDEIIEKLHFEVYEVISGSFARPNLSYSVRNVEDKEGKVLEILSRIPGSSVVYVQTRKDAKKYSELLIRNNISANYYHAGLSPFDRDKRQESWKSGKTRVIVSTNAFGMGIDKHDVRTVIHTHIPKNLESYYQEAGRAGRDSRKAFAVLIYHNDDIPTLKEQFEKSYPSLEDIQHVYQCLSNYYKLAIGSYHPSGYDFIIHDFARQYGMDMMSVFHALKKLEDEELIKLNEAFHNPSALFISSERSRLYEFQVANARYDPLIKELLRTYGGNLFNEFCQISEFKISKKLNTTESEVKKELEHLHDLGIVAYASQKDKPQLIFITPRLDAKKLPIAEKELALRKSIELEKLNKMLLYIEQVDLCRTRFFQDYFGEENHQDCGVCDICIQKNKSGSESTTVAIKDKIIKLLEKGSSSTKDLLHELNVLDAMEINHVIREMIDDGIITLGSHDQLTLNKKS